jgi:hypothetical protein
MQLRDGLYKVALTIARESRAMEYSRETDSPKVSSGLVLIQLLLFVIITFF